MNVLARSVVAVVTICSALVVAPVAARADVVPDARTQVAVACIPTSLNTGINGVTHAQMRDCSVLWVSSGASGQQGGTLNFQMRDAATDGVCAQAFIDFNTGSRHSTTTRSECNGVWTTFSYSLIGTTYWAEADLTLSYGGHGPVTAIDLNPFPPLP